MLSRGYSQVTEWQPDGKASTGGCMPHCIQVTRCAHLLAECDNVTACGAKMTLSTVTPYIQRPSRLWMVMSEPVLSC